MYACSPTWKGDWVSKDDLLEVLTQLSAKINNRYPPGFKKIGINHGFHLTGGEPFLNFELLLEATQIAARQRIPATFVETNCFWCSSDDDTKDRLLQLREAGLDGILVSVNPFILEYVPFERTERAARISKEVFGENVLGYQKFFYHQFKRLNIRSTLPFEDYLRMAGLQSLRYVELIPMDRAPYKLGNLYRRYPVERFFDESCLEELTRDWHVHVDSYCNYMVGYCGGISLGDARNLESICEKGIDLNDHVIIRALVSDMKGLYDLAVREFDCKELSEGYISKCHLCVDVRRHLVQETTRFKELTKRVLPTVMVETSARA
jgi:hypothetical protein